MRALAANEKVSRFGIRELERILDEMLANQMLQAKDAGGSRGCPGSKREWRGCGCPLRLGSKNLRIHHKDTKITKIKI
jgi:hypothetical protein